MPLRNSTLLVGLILMCIGPRIAEAQSIRDEVILTNGGMVRGTIVENLPDDHVTIQLPTGETRTFPTDEVSYAGPRRDDVRPEPALEPEPHAPASPVAAPAPSVEPEPAEVRVTFASEHERITLHRSTAELGTGMGRPFVAYEPLCTAPCAFEVPPGTYRFGVSVGDSAPTTPRTSLFPIREDSTLRVYMERHEVERIVGGLLVGVAAAVLAGSVIAFFTIDHSSVGMELGVLGGGLGGTLAIALPAVFGLLLRFDETRLELEAPAVGH